jgi:hypothetical protein
MGIGAHLRVTANNAGVARAANSNEPALAFGSTLPSCFLPCGLEWIPGLYACSAGAMDEQAVEGEDFGVEGVELD